MKVCRLASRKNFVSECGNLEFNMHRNRLVRFILTLTLFVTVHFVSVEDPSYCIKKSHIALL